MEEDGLHTLMPGDPPTAQKLEEMTEEFQGQIRNSLIWDDMLREFGQTSGRDSEAEPCKT